MAEANPKVQSMVARELKKNPALTNQDLRKKAERIDPAVKELTGRQFHAQYALPVRRKSAGPRKSSGAKRAKSAGTRAKKVAGVRRRRAGSGRKGATKRPSPAASSDPVVALLEESYGSKKQALDGAVDAAFRRALAADSVSQVNKLLGWLDRQTKAVAAK